MTGATTILLVDDEPQIPRWLAPALRAAGYEVAIAATGADALARLTDGRCDLILLDLGLPDMDGKEVIVRVREWSEAPIIVISARDQEAEKVAALDLGADDFVNKPVGIDELLARIRAALRSQSRRSAREPALQVGELEINFAARRVKIEGEEVRLTPREYDLLKVLARHAGMVLTHAQIMAAVWGAEASVEAQHVRVLMAQLRNKIEADPSSPRFLLTETGVGYRLRAEDDS
jgi:two-component system KDP operon response regulator KdpE